MSQPVESVVREVLKKNDRGIRIREAMTGGWQALKEKYPDRAWWRRKSTRAGIVWEEAVNNTIASLREDNGVVPIPHHDTVSFVMDDVVLVRLKKADMELRSSNVQTVLASLFHQHEADLYGYTGLQRVEAAYVLNQFETEMAWVGVVARQKKKPIFHFELNELATPTEMPLPFPAAPKSSPADLAKIRRVLPEDQKSDEKGE